MLVYLDTEFTDLLAPELLSIGLVTLDGREHYVELDLASPAGQARLAVASNFVRYEGVVHQWGRVAGAACSEREMGRRTGEWLFTLARESNDLVEICFDYSTDFELMEYAIRDGGLWDGVRQIVLPLNVNLVTSTAEARLAAEACYRDLSSRNLGRHHALADALALRAGYLAAG